MLAQLLVDFVPTRNQGTVEACGELAVGLSAGDFILYPSGGVFLGFELFVDAFVFEVVSGRCWATSVGVRVSPAALL
jgi:hypothetical protein